MVNIMVKEYTWSDGSKYVGEFKEGLPNGQGTLTSTDGRKYVGKFKDRKKHGQGTETFPDGTKYEWEYKNGRLSNTVYDRNGKIIYWISVPF